MIRTIAADPTYRRLAQRLREGCSGATPLAADGLWGSSAPILAASLARDVQRPLLYVTAHLDQADEARDDMELVTEGVELLSAYETLPGEGAASGDIAGQRVRLCSLLVPPEGQRPAETAPLIVAPIQALMQPVPAPAALAAGALNAASRQALPIDAVLEWLVAQSFTRLEFVEQPGDFAVRGGIVDVFAYNHNQPLRIEWDADTVDSIRFFDLSTGRSARAVQSARICGLSESASRAATDIAPFLSYLPAGAVVIWQEPAEIQEMGQIFWSRLNNPRGMYPVQKVFQQADPFAQVYCARFGGPGVAASDSFSFEVASVQRFERQPSAAVAELVQLSRDRRITLYCDNDGERRRLHELVVEQAGRWPESIELTCGLLHHGFEWTPARHVVVGHHELFHRYRTRRKIRRIHASRPLETWLDLQLGDLVVHAVHGIGRFCGLAPIRKGDSAKQEEYLTLEFAGAATIHVPASQIELVQKYIGVAGVTPALSTLGGTRWKRIKEKVQEAISEFAGELLRVQALRQSLPGVGYPQDTPWQREFEEAFLYTETEDQLKVLEEIKRDLTRPQPMDRLICGDVGYGKTELAMRAAFKVAEFGKQVAVLVPTTVLAEQHYETFRERMADYPFVIERISRFRPRAEQNRLIKEARKGQIDILIGTHRLLSKDVGFADLGLLVIDEEQRFGVEHKERLKQFRESVDVLTLTATPIPRTLHMSMVGIRDISTLASPPLDRRSIVTRVLHHDPDLIRAALIRELNRDGQVFFVHNLVYDIEDVANHIRKLVPEARVLVGHGQMKPEDLEDVMLRFMHREADVLVCTTIIESGIDIPSANTIFIDRGERFGLADLHQLRGRVGRYRHRAYCYVLLSKDRTLSPVAARRLKAIEEYSELGAGFQIAMRDLEIRGAGNILGHEQSGHIGAVGYEMYCQMLENTVRRMRGEAERPLRPVHLELQVAAHVPKQYIHADTARMEVYRRLSACATPGDLVQLEADLRDAFGPYPPKVQTLLDLAELRILAQPWSVRSIIREPPDVVFDVDDMARAQALFVPRDGLSGIARIPDTRTIHWRLPPAYLEPQTLIPVLRKLLSAAQAPVKQPQPT